MEKIPLRPQRTSHGGDYLYLDLWTLQYRVLVSAPSQGIPGNWSISTNTEIILRVGPFQLLILNKRYRTIASVQHESPQFLRLHEYSSTFITQGPLAGLLLAPEVPLSTQFSPDSSSLDSLLQMSCIDENLLSLLSTEDICQSEKELAAPPSYTNFDLPSFQNAEELVPPTSDIVELSHTEIVPTGILSGPLGHSIPIGQSCNSSQLLQWIEASNVASSRSLQARYADIFSSFQA